MTIMHFLHEEDGEIQHSMIASDWERFKGPPSAPEWTVGSVARSKATHHENEAAPRYRSV